MSEQFRDKFEDVGGLWKAKTGSSALSGKLNCSLNADTRIIITENKNKKNPKSPDFLIWVEKPIPAVNATPHSEAIESDENIPF